MQTITKQRAIMENIIKEIAVGKIKVADYEFEELDAADSFKFLE